MPLVAFDDASIDDREPRWKVAGDLIRQFAPWTWWATLTFRRIVGEEYADNAFRSWARELARNRVHDHIPVVWVREREAGNFHFHALLAMPGGDELTRRQLHEAWRLDPAAGYTYIVRYTETLGAAYYVGKKDGWDWNVACSRTHACRRRAGCRVAPTSW
jgi:hypothetical protein